jgi:hypothetical protein
LKKAKKDIFAMIRQLGSASLFCSFSSAETQWTHLLRILGKLVDNKTYTDTELENLNWEEKSRLIQSDPVTCARHFDYRPSATHENEAGKQVSFPPHGDQILISLYVEWIHFHGKTPMLYFGKHASLEKIAFSMYDVIHR